MIYSDTIIVFYLVAIIVTPFSLISFFVLPKPASKPENRNRNLDWQGVVALSGGLILLVYGLTDGNNAGALQHVLRSTDTR